MKHTAKKYRDPEIRRFKAALKFHNITQSEFCAARGINANYFRGFMCGAYTLDSNKVIAAYIRDFLISIDFQGDIKK